jgi:hypothetical protein
MQQQQQQVSAPTEEKHRLISNPSTKPRADAKNKKKRRHENRKVQNSCPTAASIAYGKQSLCVSVRKAMLTYRTLEANCIKPKRISNNTRDLKTRRIQPTTRVLSVCLSLLSQRRMFTYRSNCVKQRRISNSSTGDRRKHAFPTAAQGEILEDKKPRSEKKMNNSNSSRSAPNQVE